jgi:hypothetical protein
MNMKLYIHSFGGNRDNYYNFQRNYEDALRSLRIASRYVDQKDSPTVSIFVEKANDLLDIVEFED